MTDVVSLTVSKGFSLPDSLRQLNPDETDAALNCLAALVGTFRKTAAQPSDVKELFRDLELRNQKNKEKELQAQRLSLIEKHEQSRVLLHKQNDIENFRVDWHIPRT
jgi:hypothetical protein